MTTTILSHCYAPVQACMLRVGRLALGGAPMSGAKNMYETDIVASLQQSPEIEAGDEFTAKNGCGAVMTSVKNPDHLKRMSLSGDLSRLDAELMEMMIGGSLIVDTAVTIGQNFPLVTDDPHYISLELWSKAYLGTSQAVDSLGDPVYFHWVFPYCTFVLGQVQMNNGVNPIPLTGKSEASSALGKGPAGDLPVVADWGPSAYYLTTAIPTAACGYKDATPAP